MSLLQRIRRSWKPQLIVVSPERVAVRWPYFIGIIAAAVGFNTGFEVRHDLSPWSVIAVFGGFLLIAASLKVGGRISQNERRAAAPSEDPTNENATRP